MPALRWTSFALAGLFAAALSIPAAAQTDEPKPTSKVKLDRYLLTAEEITARPDLSTAYDAVKLLRPNFLKETRLSGRITGGYSIGESRGPGPPPSRDGSTSGASGGTGGSSGGSSGGGADATRGAAGVGTRGGSGGAFDTNPSGRVTAVLYIDDMKQPAIDELKNVRATDVFEIRLVTPAEALGRYGSGHEGGAILLKTNRMRK